MSTIADLARRQLVAYNAADLDAFCVCYHPDVVVLTADGDLDLQGMDAFRERYRPQFERGDFGGSVPTRLHVGEHCVDHELWWRVRDGERVEGELLVRYRERDGLIGVVQFLR